MSGLQMMREEEVQLGGDETRGSVLMTAGKLSKGMQQRIQRSLAGEQLPGYYPLGEAPVPIW